MLGVGCDAELPGQLNPGLQDAVGCYSLGETEAQEQYSDKLRPYPFNPGRSGAVAWQWASVGRGPSQAHTIVARD